MDRQRVDAIVTDRLRDVRLGAFTGELATFTVTR